jgi:hypothetical protein
MMKTVNLSGIKRKATKMIHLKMMRMRMIRKVAQLKLMISQLLMMKKRTMMRNLQQIAQSK